MVPGDERSSLGLARDHVRNDDVRWDQFDPYGYLDRNYRPAMLDVDRLILRLVRDFFIDAGVAGGEGLDVGAGPNLYPALAMLPFCRSIQLREFASPNVRWLQDQIAGYDPSWNAFWDELAEREPYRLIEDPRRTFGERAMVKQGSIFDLEKASWDIGTMFFVACSISEETGEFDLAVEHFVSALRPRAPFAAAFMLGSVGYDVSGVAFPSVPLAVDAVDDSLQLVAHDVQVTEIVTDLLIRPGYKAMALATGRAGPR